MTDYVPNQSANVTIGVCGEQGTGKTVFLTCIFQSIWTAFPDDVVLDFDRDQIGNADYFRDNEERIIGSGKPDETRKVDGTGKAGGTGRPAGTGTHVLFPARIYVKPYESLPAAFPPVLSVDIKDFAGGHFRSLANLTGLGAPKSSDPPDVKTLREVNEMVKTADAFVILINSNDIDPLNETPRHNPFSPSVNFLLSHCRTERKPVALLFSQADQTKRLTHEVFESLPRVQAFKRQFTADIAEAIAGKRPYGVTKRIACYETVEGDLAPVRQSLDGSIWRPEPAQVVLDLLRAAMPRINARLQAEAERERQQKEMVDLEARRRRNQRTLAGIAAVVAILLLAGLVLRWQHVQNEQKQLGLLADVETRIAQGRLASISPATEASLVEILHACRSDRSAVSPAMRSAVQNLHAALGTAAQRLAAAPALDPVYTAELARFLELLPLLDPESVATWRPGPLPLLDARMVFLSDWFGRKRRGSERVLALDEAIVRFRANDERFARVLAAQSSRDRTSQVSDSFFRALPHVVASTAVIALPA